MSTNSLIALSVAINRLIEMLKQTVLDRLFPADAQAQLRAGLALVFSLIFGVFAAFIFSANLFTEFGNVPAWAGVVVTGLVLGAGSNAVHAAIQLMTQLRDLLGARASVVPVETTSLSVVKSATVADTTAFPEAG